MVFMQGNVMRFVFPGSSRSRAGMGMGEVLNGERAERRLQQETERV